MSVDKFQLRISGDPLILDPIFIKKSVPGIPLQFKYDTDWIISDCDQAQIDQIVSIIQSVQLQYKIISTVSIVVTALNTIGTHATIAIAASQIIVRDINQLIQTDREQLERTQVFCDTCGKAFTTHNRHQAYCSAECRYAGNKKRKKKNVE